MKLILKLTLAFSILSSPAFAEDITNCVLGEASGEGYLGMVAVAEAIRNRGTLKGVYGCKAKFVKNEPEWVFILARKAILEAKTSNLTNGATHWESVDFKRPYWADSMVETVQIGKHVFYK